MVHEQIPRPPRAQSSGLTRVILVSIVLGLAVGAALTITWMGLSRTDTGIASFAVVYLEDGEGPRPGTPYVLELELEREGYPLIIHLDADGLPSLLYPIARPLHGSAGERFVLPDPSGAVTWWLPSDEEPGALLTVLSSSAPQSTDRLIELVERAASRADDAAGARRAVRKVLRRSIGPVLETELTTIPPVKG